MTSNEVLSMYENIAGLTAKMAGAAKTGDWNGLAAMEKQCASQASGVETGVPGMTGVLSASGHAPNRAVASACSSARRMSPTTTSAALPGT